MRIEELNTKVCWLLSHPLQTGHCSLNLSLQSSHASAGPHSPGPPKSALGPWYSSFIVASWTLWSWWHPRYSTWHHGVIIRLVGPQIGSWTIWWGRVLEMSGFLDPWAEVKRKADFDFGCWMFSSIRGSLQFEILSPTKELSVILFRAELVHAVCHTMLRAGCLRLSGDLAQLACYSQVWSLHVRTVSLAVWTCFAVMISHYILQHEKREMLSQTFLNWAL